MIAKSWMVILPATLLLSPFVLLIASKQDKSTKFKLRLPFATLLVFQLLLALFNWETMRGPGRSGLELALAFPHSLLILFFFLTLAQIVMVLLRKSQTDLAAVVANFINSFLIFASLIIISKTLGRQIVSFAAIAEVFLVLIGNVVALALINKDKMLLSKYPWNQKSQK